MTETPYTIETLRRGLNILTLFSRDIPDLSLTEISEMTGVNLTTTYRMASTLEQAGYLQRDPGNKRYRPGLRVLQLGFAALSSLDLRMIARPYLRQLSEKTGETVSEAVLEGLEIIYVDRIRNRQIVGVVLGVGSRLPAHCTSMGKAMLAFLPPKELRARLRGAKLDSCTHRTLVDRDGLSKDLDRVRRRGYATNHQELAMGLRAVAVPIWDEENQVAGAINITGSTEAISRRRLKSELAPLLLQTAANISQALGHQAQEEAVS